MGLRLFCFFIVVLFHASYFFNAVLKRGYLPHSLFSQHVCKRVQRLQNKNYCAVEMSDKHQNHNRGSCFTRYKAMNSNIKQSEQLLKF